MQVDLGYFLGGWRLTRQIDDLRAGLLGHLEGQSVWSGDGCGATQIETGQLRYGNAPPMAASRRYLWRALDAGGVAVLFEDGRPFHRVPGPGETARHLCDPDTYEVDYIFESDEFFSTHWRVTGPRKDMVIHSRFRRETGV